ncbi:MAG: hypothetical protein ACE5JU_02355 [Candidatus Binatia bacterium]
MSGSRILNTASRRPFLSLGLFLLFSGCPEFKPQTLPPTSPLSFKELKQTVSRIRKLPFQYEVSLESKGTNEIHAPLDKSSLQEPRNQKPPEVARVYARLGLLPEAVDLPRAVTEFRLFQLGARYDSRSKKIIVAQKPRKPGYTFWNSAQGSENEKGEIGKRFLLTQALTHALQQQHFRWEEKLRKIDAEDQRLAFRALLQGDAALVGLTHLIGDPKKNQQKILDGIKGLALLVGRMEEEIPQISELLRHKVLFEYLYGSQFVIWAYSLKGWEGVNRLYSDPPISTEQILHPEKYFVRREDPVLVIPWSLIRRFGNSGRKIFDESLGEFLIRALLSRNLSNEQAAQAAAGWAGDHLLAFQQAKEVVLAWTTVWDNPEEALEFYEAYRQALETRYGFSLVPTAAGGDTLIAPMENTTSLLLQIRGNLVFFLDGVAWPRSAQIAQDLWEELEIESKPQPIPFDLVQRPVDQAAPARK